MNLSVSTSDLPLGPDFVESFEDSVRSRLAAFDNDEIALVTAGSGTILPIHFWLLSRHKGRLLSDDTLIGVLDELKGYHHSAAAILEPYPPGWRFWIPDCLSVISRDLSVQEGEMTMRYAPEEAGEFAEYMSCAWNALAKIWPAAAREAELLVRHILPIESPKLRSATTPFAFGAVLVGIRPDWTLARALEILVHEIAHHSLYVRQATVTLASDCRVRLRSPLRTDYRPPMSLLHVAFVCVRVADGLDRFSALHSEHAEEALEIRNTYLADLEDVLPLLYEQTCWTVNGRRLIRTLRGSHGRLKRRFFESKSI